MCQYSSEDGFPTDWHLVHLGSRAVGGAGLVIQEASAVSPEGRISAGDAGIYQEAHIEAWSRITRFIREQGAVAGIQLAHAGRKASSALPWEGGKQIPTSKGGWLSFAPSAIPFKENDEAPDALTVAGIEKVISDFKEAARRALAAGYQLIEIHAAHGYLINEFLSPLTNHRKDDYGGGFENRIRLLLDVLDAVQSVWPPELPIFVRISAVDWVEGGWTIEDSVALVKILKLKGVDLVDCSSGGLVPQQKITLGPAYQTPFAEKIRQETGMSTGTVGLITEADQAEAILAEGRADLIFLAREFLRDPYFPIHAANKMSIDLTWPKQYIRAKK